MPKKKACKKGKHIQLANNQPFLSSCSIFNMLEKIKMIQVFWKDLQNIFASAILIFAGNCNAKGGLSSYSYIITTGGGFQSSPSLTKEEMMSMNHVSLSEVLQLCILLVDIVRLCYTIFSDKKEPPVTTNNERLRKK